MMREKPDGGATGEAVRAELLSCKNWKRGEGITADSGAAASGWRNNGKEHMTAGVALATKEKHK